MDVYAILDLKGDFVITIPPEATIDEAAEILAENYIGAIVVSDGAGQIAGILSDRDIAVASLRYGGELGETKISEIKTSDMLFCTKETTVKQVLDIMVTNGIRRLPVVEIDQLKGVISLRDVVGNWLGAITNGEIGGETDAKPHDGPLGATQDAA